MSKETDIYIYIHTCDYQNTHAWIADVCRANFDENTTIKHIIDRIMADLHYLNCLCYL